MALRGKCPYGKAVFDHLAADGAGFPGSQVAVVTVGQVDAHFLGSLHLELVHSLTGLGNVDLVVVLHTVFSPFCRYPESKDAFRWKIDFSFRKHSFARNKSCMPECFWKGKQFVEGKNL